MIVERFTAKNGRTVVLRKPKWEDLDDLLDFINSLVEEEAPILRTEKISRIEEVEWLAKRLVSIEKNEIIHLVAEVDGRVVAGGEIAKHRGHMSHVGTLGIAVKNGYRRIGIATKLIETLIREGKRQGLKLIILDVYENNHHARALYRKLGFKEVGKVPKAVFWKGKYVGEIRMALEIEK
jgi:ribosomal protein S18 acetylase RimI-like enzyme